MTVTRLERLPEFMDDPHFPVVRLIRDDRGNVLKGSYCPRCLEVFSSRDEAAAGGWKRANLIGREMATTRHDCHGKLADPDRAAMVPE